MPTARATSGDVARLAGLSRSAVSQILNGNETRFPPETRERVFAAAAELNYRPSKAGRALVTGVSELALLVVPNVTFGRHLQDAVDQIARRSAAHGMSVVVRYAGADPAATLDAVLDLQPALVLDMGVLTAEAVATLHAAGIRTLPATSMADPNAHIGRLQATHLRAAGRERLVYALLADDRQDPYGPLRAAGARQAGGADLTTVRVPLSRAGAVAALAPLLGPPVGVACYNDEVAIAVLAAARELGLAVPGQVAVVGADHTEVGQLITPRLTTVRVDLTAMLDRTVPEAVWRGDSRGTAPATDLTSFITLVPGETA